jgi:hypothetical protein
MARANRGEHGDSPAQDVSRHSLSSQRTAGRRAGVSARGIRRASKAARLPPWPSGYGTPTGPPLRRRGAMPHSALSAVRYMHKQMCSARDATQTFDKRSPPRVSASRRKRTSRGTDQPELARLSCLCPPAGSRKLPFARLWASSLDSIAPVTFSFALSSFYLLV